MKFVMKFNFLDLSFNLSLLDYLSYPHSLTNFTPKERKPGTTKHGITHGRQLKQVYGTVYVYQRPGILRFVSSRVGSQLLDGLLLSLVRLKDLDLTRHEGIFILHTILLIQLLAPSLHNGSPHL